MRSGFLKGVFMFAVAAAVSCLALSGCRRSGEGGGAEVPAEAGHPLKVVTTLFPYYDFTRQIAGENIELSMVIPAGMDSHSFEPTPADIRLIEEADLFICNGGHMEQWVSQVLSSLDTPSMTVVTKTGKTGMTRKTSPSTRLNTTSTSGRRRPMPWRL